MQETFIFGGTIRDNLRIAKPDAADQEMRRVLEQVELDVWTDTLPGGLDHDLDGGLGLSAGQKQRIGIARALLADVKVLLLDEPTSALDPETERQVLATLHLAAKGRAVILATHRLDTVVEADEIIVLEKGEIVERGTHHELLAKAGLYADMRRLHRSLIESSPKAEEALT